MDCEHLSVAIIGPKNSGKTTIEGQLSNQGSGLKKELFGTLVKARKENDKTWMPSILNHSGRLVKGRSIACPKSHFLLDNKMFTIFDTPGDTILNPEVRSAIFQADVAILVLSACRGEFESAFDRGVIQQHATIVQHFKVPYLVVVVNKMDHPTIDCSRGRFLEIVGRMKYVIQMSGLHADWIQFLPVSGLLGLNLKASDFEWWNGLSLLDMLKKVVIPTRSPQAPLRIPVTGIYYQGEGVGYVVGKVEEGTVQQGNTTSIKFSDCEDKRFCFAFYPEEVIIELFEIFSYGSRVPTAGPGEHVLIQFSVSSSESSKRAIPGYVGVTRHILGGVGDGWEPSTSFQFSSYTVSSVDVPVYAVLEFNAKIWIPDMLDTDERIIVGYQGRLYICTSEANCVILNIYRTDIGARINSFGSPLYVPRGQFVTCRMKVNQSICLGNFHSSRAGSFILCSKDNKIVAVGQVTEVPPLGLLTFTGVPSQKVIGFPKVKSKSSFLESHNLLLPEDWPSRFDYLYQKQ